MRCVGEGARPQLLRVPSCCAVYMLESLIVSIIQRRLGQFVETDKKALSVGLWSGKIRLKNVALRPDSLYSLGLPLAVHAGSVDLMELDIPWRSLGKDVVHLRLNGVRATVGTLDIESLANGATAPSKTGCGAEQTVSEERLREWAWRRKQYHLQRIFESAQLGEEVSELLERSAALSSGGKRRKPKASRAPKKTKRGGLTSKLKSSNSLISRILDSLCVSLAAVHLRFEGYGSRRGFAFGLTLEALSTSFDAGAGEASPGSAKRVSVEGLSLYHVDGAAAAPGADAADRSLLLQPTSLTALLGGPSIRERLLAASAAGRGPSMSVDVTLSELAIRASKDELRHLSRAASRIVEAAETLRALEITLFIAGRVPHPPAEAPAGARPRAWWQYAIARVLLELEMRRSWRCSARFFAERRQLRLRYVGLYRQLMGGAPSSRRLGTRDLSELTRDLLAMERDELTAEDIFAFRAMAATEAAASEYGGGGGPFSSKSSSSTAAAAEASQGGGGGAGLQAICENGPSHGGQSAVRTTDVGARASRASASSTSSIKRKSLLGRLGSFAPRLSRSSSASCSKSAAASATNVVTLDAVSAGMLDAVVSEAEPLVFAAAERPLHPGQALDEHASRYVAALVVGDDDDDETCSASGSVLTASDGHTSQMDVVTKHADGAGLSGAGGAEQQAKKRAAVEHTVRLTIRGVSLTLSISTGDLVQIRVGGASGLVCLGPDSSRVCGQLESFDVVNCSAPPATLGHLLASVRSGMDDDVGATTADTPPRKPVAMERADWEPGSGAIHLEWSSLPQGHHQTSALVMHVKAPIELVYAPLVVVRLLSVVSVGAEVQAALMVQQLHSYARRVMWSGARRQDLLNEIIADHKRMALNVQLMGVRVRLAAEVCPDQELAALEVGASRVVSMAPASSDAASTPAEAASVASASLHAEVLPTTLEAVHTTLYDRVRVELDSVRAVLVRSSGGAPQVLCSCDGGVAVDVATCILPPASHGLEQTRVQLCVGGVDEAPDVMDGPSLVLRASAADCDALEAILLAVTAQTTAIRQTLGVIDSPSLRATWSKPISAEVAETVEALSSMETASEGARRTIQLRPMQMRIELLHDDAPASPAAVSGSPGSVGVIANAVGDAGGTCYTPPAHPEAADERTTALFVIFDVTGGVSIRDGNMSIDVDTTKLVVDDDSPIAGKPARLLECPSLSTKVVLASQGDGTGNSDLRITLVLGELRFGWTRHAAEQLYAWRWPSALVQFCLSKPQAWVWLDLGRVRCAFYEPSGAQRLALSVGSVKLHKHPGDEVSNVMASIGTLSVHCADKSRGFCEALSARGDATTPWADFSVQECISQCGGEDRLVVRITLQLQPISMMLTHSMLSSALSCTLGEMALARERAVFVEQYKRASSAAIVDDTPEEASLISRLQLRMELAGASVRVFAEEDSGFALDVAWLEVRSAAERANAGEHRTDGGVPAAGDALVARLERVSLHETRAADGADSIPIPRFITRDASFELTMALAAVPFKATWTGGELNCELSTSQLHALQQLANCFQEAIAAASPAQEGKRTTRSASQLALYMHQQRVAITLFRTGGTVLSAFLDGIRLEMRQQPGCTKLVGRVAKWRVGRGPQTTNQSSFHQSKALLSSKHVGSEMLRAKTRMPMLCVERITTHASNDSDLLRPAKPAKTTVGVSCCCTACMARVTMLDGFTRANVCRRLCSLWLPLMRLALLILCCGPLACGLVSELVTQLCTLVCDCACSRGCARVYRHLESCLGRRTAHWRKRRPLADDDAQPSLELTPSLP